MSRTLDRFTRFAITVADMERAIAFAKRKIAAKKSVFVLPTVETAT